MTRKLIDFDSENGAFDDSYYTSLAESDWCFAKGSADATASARIQYCAPCSLVHALDIFALQLYGPASYAISYGRFTQLSAFIFENLES